MAFESLSNTDYAVVAGYFMLCLGIGVWSMFRPNRDTIEGYFLAGKYMFWLPVGASLFASNIGSEHFIGLAGSGAASGLATAAFEYNSLILLQLLGFVFLPVFIASKVRTVPEFMVKRFGGSRISTYLAVISMILYIFTKISVDLYSGALFIQQALNWNLYYSIMALLGLTCLCTLGGGLAAVIYIDVIQVLIMLGGSSVLLYKGLEAVGGWEELQRKYLTSAPNITYWSASNTSVCGLSRPDSWTILREPYESDMPWPGFILGQTPTSVWYWCADQMMVQKALSAKSLSDAQGATIFTGWIKILPMFLIVVPGMISKVLYPDTVGCVDPEICQAVCGNPVSCSNTAYPALVLGIMPEGLRGMMIAVMLAALMSDLTSIFNSASTLFTIDVYKQFRKSAGIPELLLVGRCFILLMVCISIGWIPIIQEMQGGQLYIYIQSVAAYLSPPIAIVYCLAIFWDRTNEPGAFWGLMYGLVVGLVRMILDFSFKEPNCMEQDNRPSIVSKVHYMYFAAGLFISTAIVTVAVSLATPPCPANMLIRTTFKTRKSKEVREDEDEDEDKKMTEEDDEGIRLKMLKDPLDCDNDDEADDENDVRIEEGVGQKLLDWLRGVERKDGEKHHQNLKSHIEELAHLPQTILQKSILYCNLVIIVGIAFFFYIYFSINPFNEAELQVFKEIALNSTSTSVYSSPRIL
ncbi:sodium/myo-inositol cotransporter [Eurytemora carolleeae]|uniref:sodium/myo-inositol cotransporter n=1 Tax=Eurytemora carolleeae TaxID=1294199 RepID=UPI000C7618FA|nr:sodium/myo-inositol cotransporter [Eurytemora carolleeae]|eukprot:XP_023338850.1 sodium/myo-inositol cotransporter-like [Eurytemora affinis]